MTKIRLASTKADRERIFRFRYEVYVEEMERTQKEADHGRRVIVEALDAPAFLWLAEDGDTTVGTVRANLGANTDFGYYAQLFEMRSVGDAFPNEVMLTTKMMIHRDYRSGTLAARMSVVVYDFARENHIKHNFIDCNAHLEEFFTRLGFKPYCGYVQHPEYGVVLPMRGDVDDLAHLKAVGSPFARSKSWNSKP